MTIAGGLAGQGAARPHLSLARIAQMNIGFFGLQFSFGLQQSNMGPIYSYLGADPGNTLLWLAGPMTGLLVQPVIGALSDRTVTRIGRRTPYFLIGAVIASIGLLAMPYSPSLWVAASLLWILDAANNITMEPYRAYVADRLDVAQRPFGFLSQSAFTGLAQTLSYLAPSLLVWWGMSADALDANGIPQITRAAFVIGAFLSLASILWSVLAVPELPLDAAEIARIRARPASFAATLREIADAIREMPRPMRQLGLAMLFQWFAMFAYWQFIVFAIARALPGGGDPGSVRAATLVNGQLGAFYNLIAFLAAFALVPLARRWGAGRVHAVCISASGAAMLAIPHLAGEGAQLAAMFGIGLGWASLMGCPYILLANSIPPERTGVYMGIFNMFIVIPMMIETLVLYCTYHPLFGGDPRTVLSFAGLLMFAAAAATLAMGRTPSRKAQA